MAQDEFTKLFTHMNQRFDAVDKRFDEQNGKIDEILASISNLAGDLKTYHEELLALGHKVDRLERWILEVANKTGVTLSP